MKKLLLIGLLSLAGVFCWADETSNKKSECSDTKCSVSCACKDDCVCKGKCTEKCGCKCCKKDDAAKCDAKKADEKKASDAKE